MTRAIRIHSTGGPEVMRWEDFDPGHPGAGEVRLRHTAIGVNYLDTYHRSGLYPMPLPMVLGSEAAGIVEEIGPGVHELKPGDRVAYAMERGSYAEARLVRADRLVALPAGIADAQAAAMMLKGMTAQYLLLRTYKVKPGETILFHAAAGGVGLIACQWARHLGATVIGTVGSDEKARLAREHGCTHPIVYTREDFVARVSELTQGAKVPVVYDSVGKDTFFKSLDCLKPLGLIVSFGQSSGSIGPFDTGILAAKGSLYLTRPTLGTYAGSRADLLATARDLFEVVTKGIVKIAVNHTYPLREAAQAHRDLEARRTTGSIVLTV